MRRNQPREVVYVERGGDASAKWLFWGACLGAGLALLYAPRSGEETRRVLQRRLWKLRAMTEEKMDELVEQYVPGRRPSGGNPTTDPSLAADYIDDEADTLEMDAPLAEETPRPRPVSAREELERRLADARARRRRDPAPTGDFEEPLA